MINIYCLIDPRNNKPFYVGATNCTINIRLSGHINEVKTYSRYDRSAKQALIKEILQAGKKPRVRLLFVATIHSVDYYEHFFYSLFIQHGYTLLQRNVAFWYSRKLESERNNYNKWLTTKMQLAVCNNDAKINAT